MLVSKSWCEETAKDIIWEFENLLCNNDVKINNMNPEENEFESEDSYINKKDYENLKEKVTEQLIELLKCSWLRLIYQYRQPIRSFAVKCWIIALQEINCSI